MQNRKKKGRYKQNISLKTIHYLYNPKIVFIFPGQVYVNSIRHIMVKGREVLKKDQTTTGSNTKLLQDAVFLQKNRDWLRYSMAIAVKVQGRMVEKGMNQVQLAEILGCTQQYVSVLLKGRENLTLETIAKLENVLGISLMTGLASLVDGYSIPDVSKRHLLNEPEQAKNGSGKAKE